MTIVRSIRQTLAAATFKEAEHREFAYVRSQHVYPSHVARLSGGENCKSPSTRTTIEKVTNVREDSSRNYQPDYTLRYGRAVYIPRLARRSRGLPFRIRPRVIAVVVTALRNDTSKMTIAVTCVPSYYRSRRAIVRKKCSPISSQAFRYRNVYICTATISVYNGSRLNNSRLLA